jgi:type IX secretion system PorP/SprF family membrane protein
MKHSILLFIATLALLFSGNQLYAQDPEFTQFYANPLYLNPALAGTRMCPRVCLNYRNQWPAISGQFVTYSASFDKMAYKLHGGVGFLLTQDNAGGGTIKTTNVSAIYSYNQKITRFFSIAAAMQVTYSQKSVDWSKLNFGDMIDPKAGFVYNTQEVQGLGSRSNVDISSGIVGYSDHFFVGFAAHHLTTPNESMYQSGYSPLPMKFTAHAGVTIPVGGTRRSPDFTISPNILWQKQQDFQQLNLGIYIQKSSIVGGLWYRNQDSFIILIGLEEGLFRVGYSYDMTVSKLTNATAGAHELSMSMTFPCKPPKPTHRLISCPSF